MECLWCRGRGGPYQMKLWHKCVSARLWGMVPNTAGIFPHTISRKCDQQEPEHRWSVAATQTQCCCFPQCYRGSRNLPSISPMLQDWILPWRKCVPSLRGGLFLCDMNFLRGGRPREEIFARHGLHLNGAGVDCLEACFQQALSTVYLTDRVTAARMRRMAKLGYWGDSSGLALRVWPLVRAEIVGLEFPVKWVFWLPCGGRFKNAYELLNLRALKISMLYKNHIFQCMGKIFYVEFQRYPLKFHTKYLTHTLKDVDFIHNWKFKSS